MMGVFFSFYTWNNFSAKEEIEKQQDNVVKNKKVLVSINKDTEYVNFDTLKENKINFVYLKATQGSSKVDNTFEEYFEKAKKAGLKIGSQLYFEPTKTGDEQFYFFINNIEDYGDLPISINIPDSIGVANNGNKNLIRLLDDFNNFLPDQSIILKGSEETVFNMLDQDEFKENDFWIESKKLKFNNSKIKLIQFNDFYKIGEGMKQLRLTASINN